MSPRTARRPRARSTKRPLLALLCAALILSAGVPRGQDLLPSRPLTPAIQSDVIDRVARALAQTYVDPDAALAIGRALLANWTAGAYDVFTDPVQFARAITSDLREINGDLHLGLRFSPPQPTPGQAPPQAAPSAETNRNAGFTRVDILDGNVGYLEMSSFGEIDGYEDAIVAALRSLAGTEAIIVDLRRNGGGSSAVSHFLFSHFLPATAVPTIRVRTRNDAAGEVRESLASVPGPRRPDVPLFVLTSPRTASAAEEFCFVLQNQRRATIVGTRTAGAGRMVAFRRMGYGFTLGVSIARVSDPVTAMEWEQIGVQPDVAVGAEQALQEAHAWALRAIRTADSRR